MFISNTNIIGYLLVTVFGQFLKSLHESKQKSRKNANNLAKINAFILEVMPTYISLCFFLPLQNFLVILIITSLGILFINIEQLLLFLIYCFHNWQNKREQKISYTGNYKN